MTAERAIRLVLSGRVQGVGFRWWLSRKVSHLPIRGWVSNLPDGRVEVVASGDEASLLELERIAIAGPRSARVDNVDKSDVQHQVVHDNNFTIK